MCFFFKHKTAYEMRISDWSSDVCSSDLPCREIAAQQIILLVGRPRPAGAHVEIGVAAQHPALGGVGVEFVGDDADRLARGATRAARAIRDRLAAAEPDPAERVVQFGGVRAGKLGEHLPFLPPRQIGRSEEHTSELQSLMRISYAVFCLKK